MPLQSSGAISLAQVNQILLYETGTISLGDDTVRRFFQKPSGAISLSDGYGKYSVATLSGHSHSGTHGGYNFAIFGGSGTMSFTGNTVGRVILVGGGGAGGAAGGGGGGSGGVHENNYTFGSGQAYGVVVGSGGTAVAPPITGVPTNGTKSYIYRIADNAIIAEAGGGGYGGTRNAANRLGGSPTGVAGGGGGAAYAGSSGAGGTANGGLGISYYGGGGGGARTSGGAGVSPNGGNGGFSYSFPSTNANAVRPQWTVNSFAATQVIELGGGGGGSGFNNSNAGSGGAAGSGVFTYANPSGARYYNKDNVYQYYGDNGERTTSSSFPSATYIRAGMGGGGGAYATANGTVGNANYRLGGNGASGLVVVRWAQ